MKKFLFLVIALMTFSFQSFADDAKKNDKQYTTIGFEFHHIFGNSSTIHRAPIHIEIEAYHYEDSNSIEIHSEDDVIGEVRLYLDGNLIDYSPEVNTIFQLPDVAGTYKIEVTGSSWIAEGYLQLN